MSIVQPLPDPRKLSAPRKGRGTTTQIAHRFEGAQREVDEHVELAPSGDQALWGEDDVAAPVPTQVTPEQARSILSRNDSPDIPFTWSINPYRGCEHGCIYCYARPTHSYLNLSPGLDFETRLMAKVNAADLLRRELARQGHEPSPINIGSATDPYQPVEREWRITRGVLEVLHACQHPFTIVTKSSGVERDLDILSVAGARKQAYVMISITTLDSDLSRRLEPRAAAPMRRLQTVQRLAQAGVPVGVNVAPIIPFLNEPEIEQIIEAAALAGAMNIHYTVVRLPWEVKPLFEEWLMHHVPDKAARIMARVRELRGGKDYDADFSLRMKGEGVWARLIAQRVRKSAARHGMGRLALELDSSHFDRSALHQEDEVQLGLF
ncbi:MAG TPA: PA0069 family radical SAM protein [Aquabacterium sp.]|uniref:PA0069 family radical SAM protein n=1 Tax=Aquabacterium sp. TaxID=1872578 RepID=UPI002E323A47|nr:PA0069 family radical SAM protein [Aquabacterium sp.]HEX5354566.1 PA0069 family radical SAM protein [Aquabacterium sp.]